MSSAAGDEHSVDNGEDAPDLRLVQVIQDGDDPCTSSLWAGGRGRGGEGKGVGYSIRVREYKNRG